ncbi:MAG TPA: 4'-phosphopantetheinyl transferase superfamily protein [Polyangiaceae bacterium]|nr:4'-phosphopantetheinyl transferase superfamily protein [Polyangiaceae bacterium]
MSKGPSTRLRDWLLPAEASFAWLVVDDAGFDGLEPLLPGEGPGESSRWAPKRLREFRAGRQVLRRALHDIGHPAQPLPRDADGLPRLPAELAASLTHTGQRTTFAAAAALPTALGLGLDAEELRPFALELSERILDVDERRALASHGSLDALGLWAFSAKEAFYKCVYPRTRRFLEFQQVQVALVSRGEADGEQWGEFVARSAVSAQGGGPDELRVRVVADASRVLSAAIWR